MFGNWFIALKCNEKLVGFEAKDFNLQVAELAFVCISPYFAPPIHEV